MPTEIRRKAFRYLEEVVSGSLVAFQRRSAREVPRPELMRL